LSSEVTNDPTKATRVRIFLLQCVARKQRSNYDGEIMVNKFSDAPNIIYKQNGRVKKQLSFVDAMVQHGKLINSEEIIMAKRIAGRAYEGSLKEYFLILKDADSPNALPCDDDVLEASGTGPTTPVTSTRQSLGSVLKRKLSESTIERNKRKK